MLDIPSTTLWNSSLDIELDAHSQGAPHDLSRPMPQDLPHPMTIDFTILHKRTTDFHWLPGYINEDTAAAIEDTFYPTIRPPMTRAGQFWSHAYYRASIRGAHLFGTQVCVSDFSTNAVLYAVAKGPQTLRA